VDGYVKRTFAGGGAVRGKRGCEVDRYD
jgi:hypothetical protein